VVGRNAARLEPVVDVLAHDLSADVSSEGER
jgi:hypothetical protein